MRTSGRDGREETHRADLIVHGAGRVPDIDDLGLEAAGIERSRRGSRRQRLPEKRFQSQLLRL